MSMCFDIYTLTFTNHTSAYNLFSRVTSNLNSVKILKHNLNLSPSQQEPKLGQTFENATMLI